MLFRLNFRLIFIALLLAVLAGMQIAREDRPAVLATGQRLHAYVANSGDGTITVLDLAGLSAVATVNVGRAPSNLRPLKLGAQGGEIWGLSGSGSGSGSNAGEEEGRVWVLRAADNKIAASIPA